MLNFRAIKVGEDSSDPMFFRGDLPIELSQRELTEIKLRKITTVLDLRTDEEIKEMPCQLASDPEITYRRVDLWVGDVPETPAQVSQSYIEMARQKSAIRSIFEILADAPGAALIHCTAGKDRTGIISAILMLLAGMEEDQIVGEYMVSAERLKSVMGSWVEKGYPMASVYPKKEYMEGFLRRFLREFLSIENYLNVMGISPQTQQKLKSKLIIGRRQTETKESHETI